MPTIVRRLEGLEKKAIASGQYVVAAAVRQALAYPQDIDLAINVIGAMHEVGLLRNSLGPYWRHWHDALAEWPNRCIARLAKGDHDYWAVAGLLGLPSKRIVNALQETGYHQMSLRYATNFEAPDKHIATFAIAKSNKVWAPVFEIGWNSESGEVTDVARWRAVLVKTTQEYEDNRAISGFGSYYLRARLPYGSWRIHETAYEVKAEWLIRPDGSRILKAA